MATEYPRDYNFAKDGKRCALHYRALRKAAVSDFSDPSRKLEKYIVEGDLEESGETVSLWLGEFGKLVTLFRDELARRVKNGKTDFEGDELIVVTQSNEQRQSRTSSFSMWDYEVAFEHAGPPPTAAELMLDGSTGSNGGAAMDELAGETEQDYGNVPF